MFVFAEAFLEPQLCRRTTSVFLHWRLGAGRLGLMAEIETALLDSLNIFHAFARKRLNDPELAADAVQDALLKALKSPDAPNDQEKVVPWFYQILRRTTSTFIDGKRHARRPWRTSRKSGSPLHPRTKN